MRAAHRAASAFTIVEVLVAIAILGLFSLSAFYALMSFNDRAARNRNAEAVRAILQSNVDAVLVQSKPPDATADGTDLDGDGLPDGVLINSSIPIVVQRVADPTLAPVVTGSLYERVTPVGTTIGLPTAGELVMVQFMLVYTYRTKTFTSKLTTYKAAP